MNFPDNLEKIPEKIKKKSKIDFRQCKRRTSSYIMHKFRKLRLKKSEKLKSKKKKVKENKRKTARKRWQSVSNLQKFILLQQKVRKKPKIIEKQMERKRVKIRKHVRILPLAETKTKNQLLKDGFELNQLNFERAKDRINEEEKQKLEKCEIKIENVQQIKRQKLKKVKSQKKNQLRAKIEKRKSFVLLKNQKLEMAKLTRIQMTQQRKEKIKLKRCQSARNRFQRVKSKLFGIRQFMTINRRKQAEQRKIQSILANLKSKKVIRNYNLEQPEQRKEEVSREAEQLIWILKKKQEKNRLMKNWLDNIMESNEKDMHTLEVEITGKLKIHSEKLDSRQESIPNLPGFCSQITSQMKQQKKELLLQKKESNNMLHSLFNTDSIAKMFKNSLSFTELQFIREQFLLKFKCQRNFAQIQDYIKKLDFFKRFNRNIGITLLQKSTYTIHEKGDIIIRQGDFGDTLYCIVRGSCDVIIRKPNILGELEDTLVANIYDGNHFGDIALMKKYENEEEKNSLEQKRLATIICNEVCDLLAITRHDFQTFILPQITLELGDTLRCLQNLQFYQETPIYRLIPLAANFERLHFRYGEIILNVGDCPEYFAIIEKGECKLIYEQVKTNWTEESAQKQLNRMKSKFRKQTNNEEVKGSLDRYIFDKKQIVGGVQSKNGGKFNSQITFQNEYIKPLSKDIFITKHHVDFGRLKSSDYFGGRAIFPEIYKEKRNYPSRLTIVILRNGLMHRPQFDDMDIKGGIRKDQSWFDFRQEKLREAQRQTKLEKIVQENKFSLQ